ncbi:hypothetical protein D9611_011399 [Ephemerocybe angulata]|uniref:Uncharacterized protein n=1 Tax=Ephemerocybe angulata TaxID=980116 RepID=A0A8H5BCB1_9AGAR|nr:hypothetical protein D9611_011399 [Tulosesus angulatus]
MHGTGWNGAHIALDAFPTVLEGYVSAWVYGSGLGQIFDRVTSLPLHSTSLSAQTTRLSDPLLAFCYHSALPWTASANDVDVLDVVQAAGSAFAQRHAALQNLLFRVSFKKILCQDRRPENLGRSSAASRLTLRDVTDLIEPKKPAAHHHHPEIPQHRRRRNLSVSSTPPMSSLGWVTKENLWIRGRVARIVENEPAMRPKPCAQGAVSLAESSVASDLLLKCRRRRKDVGMGMGILGDSQPIVRIMPCLVPCGVPSHA